jgi:hypothetical protein
LSLRSPCFSDVRRIFEISVVGRVCQKGVFICRHSTYYMFE